MKRTNPGSTMGGRRMTILDANEVCVVNKSNIDLQFQDCEPPFQLCVLRAGDIDPATESTNCVQLYTKASADKALLDCGEGVEHMTKRSGEILMARARQLGSFREAWAEVMTKLGRNPKLVDLSQRPDQIRSRALVTKALLRAGKTAEEIPAGATILELQQLHQETIAGRKHTELLDIEGIEPTTPASKAGGRRTMGDVPAQETADVA